MRITGNWHRVVRIAVTGVLLLTAFSVLIPVAQDGDDDTEQGDPFVERLMARMSDDEKVGQLFLVTFEGQDLGPRSAIVDLLTNYKIGGVVLLDSNRNFANDEGNVEAVIALNRKLQEWASVDAVPISPTLSITATTVPTATAFISPSLTPTPLPSPTLEVTATHVPTVYLSGIGVVTGVVTRENYVPLFIAIEHEGDGYPYTHLRRGLTAVPNNMAIGATWNTDNAFAVGRIVGRELSTLGFNMLLGPSLDVLDRPRLERPSDLGTRCFGGDPYWVGVMGKAYIRGVHAGSNGRMATVAKHFPGLGGSDRRVNQEIATVQKSLEELKRVELVPFFAVAQDDKDPSAVTDAMMTAHIRFGAVRMAAKPVSFDAEAMHLLLNISPLSTWRQGGGVIVSDALGVPAVRKYADPHLKTFNHRYVAREAFNAGNDILLLSHFALYDSWEAHYRNVVDTIEFFREQYKTDLSFRARVDEAVRRILTLKHRLYPQFSLRGVLPDPDRAQEVMGQGAAEVVRMAQEAVTLLSPDSTDRLPPPPAPGEEWIIFVDDRRGADCETCEPYYLIPPSSLKQTLVRLYGPQASGRVDPERIHTYTFTQLKTFLLEPERDPQVVARLEGDLDSADWLLFAMLDVDTERYPQSDAVKEFLSLREDALQGKKTVVLAYNAPYFLDTTEVSKLSAYYCMYSRLPAFIDASVRALFQEFPPLGASPVTVEGINYNLFVQLAPDPDQVIEVHQKGMPETDVEGTPRPLEVKKGDKLQLYTSVILDRNGHPVPDGTPVEFRFFYPDEKLETRQVAFTVGGVAATEFVLDRAGRLEISVIGSEAKLLAQVPEDRAVEFQTVVPTPTPTNTSTPTPTPTDTPTPTPTPTDTPTLTPTPTNTPTPTPIPVKRVTGQALSFTMLELIAVGIAVFLVLLGGGRGVSVAMRWGLLCVIGGLVGYDLYAMGMPVALRARHLSEQWGGVIVATIGCIAAVLIGVVGEYLWRQRRGTS